MTFHDISVLLGPSTVHFPGIAPIAERRIYSRIEGGQPAESSAWCLDSHAGTHVDAPKHFVLGGTGIDELDLSIFVGSALVWNIRREAGAIEPSDLPTRAQLGGIRRVLLKTRNTAFADDHAFHSDYIALGIDGAHHLLDLGVQLIGIDYLSIESFVSPDYPVHKAIFEAEAVPIEGLDLRSIAPGTYELIALPLRLDAGEASPVRAILCDAKRNPEWV